ncbi:MAG: cupin domain-containing protein [Salinivenus sp.]
MTARSPSFAACLDVSTAMPFFTLDDLDRSEEIPGFLGAFLHSENMTVANWSVEAGAEFPEHAHPHEQISVVTEGEFELTLDGETDVLREGRVAVIPAHTPHSGRAVTDCEIIDVFSPVREDYRQ